LVISLDRECFNCGSTHKSFSITDDGKTNTLLSVGAGAVCYGINGDVAGTLDASYYKGCGERSGVEREVVCQAVDCRNCTESEKNGALQSNSAHSLNGNNVIRIRYIVRRLTPLECERLQGFPDGFTDIGEWIDSKGKKRKTTDANRYKALGNSIALPSWKWVLKRISAQYERDATMVSLFDGIGGFPILWEQINGTGTCLWASEIEDFCVAVTKRRFNNG
jgi:site-specific DNA-cytosine methylase